MDHRDPPSGEGREHRPLLLAQGAEHLDPLELAEPGQDRQIGIGGHRDAQLAQRANAVEWGEIANLG